jgi:AcrR family transcriptional regulator
MARRARSVPPPLPSLAGEPRGADVTRERLLRAAHELFYERVGAPASVSEICERAGVNVAMVKYCFGAKDGLLDALVERVLVHVGAEVDRLAVLEASPSEKLAAHITAVVRNYDRYPYINRLLAERLRDGSAATVDRLSRVFAQPTRDWYARLLASGAAQEGWRPIDPTLFFFSLIGVCEFIFSARAWLERGFGERMDPAMLERYVEHAIALLEVGVRDA